MQNRLQAWHVHLAIALAAATMVTAAAFYFQQRLGLAPCPLCVLQRYAFILLGLTALAAILHRPVGRLARRVYASLMLTWAIAGAAVAVWQISLAYRAVAVSCKISAEEKFVNGLPFARWWPGMFEAYGDCTGDGYTLLGLSIPVHALIAFLVLGALVISAARLRR
jgi:protein dithiol:quinone oxidoreductase